jgi:hypothetical protein
MKNNLTFFKLLGAIFIGSWMQKSRALQLQPGANDIKLFSL